MLCDGSRHLLLCTRHGAGYVMCGCSLASFPFGHQLQTGDNVIENVASKGGLRRIVDDESAQLKNAPDLRAVWRPADDSGGANVSGLRAAAEADFADVRLRRHIHGAAISNGLLVEIARRFGQYARRGDLRLTA